MGMTGTVVVYSRGGGGRHEKKGGFFPLAQLFISTPSLTTSLLISSEFFSSDDGRIPRIASVVIVSTVPEETAFSEGFEHCFTDDFHCFNAFCIINIFP